MFFAPLEFTPLQDEVNPRIAALFEEAGIPVVLLDRHVVPFPQRSRYDLVGIDNRRAGYLAARHLLDRGHDRVAFVGLAGAAPTIDARIAGFRDALLYGLL